MCEPVVWIPDRRRRSCQWSHPCSTGTRCSPPGCAGPGPSRGAGTGRRYGPSRGPCTHTAPLGAQDHGEGRDDSDNFIYLDF